MARQSTEVEIDCKGCLLNADRISPGTAGEKKDADEEQIDKTEQNGAIYEIMKFKCEKN